MLMLFPGTALRTLRHKVGHLDPYGKTSTTMFAAWPVGIMAAAAETGLYQFSISLRIDMMFRRDHLGASELAGQVTA